MDQLHEQKFTSLLTDDPSNVMRTCLRSCVGPTTRAWLLTCPNTFSFHLSSTHFLKTLHICVNIPHPIVLHFSQCQRGHTINNLGIHLLHCLCRNEHNVTHDMF
jgi:hypothetical protein